MAVIEIILVVLMVLAAAVLTFAVLRQSSKSQGLSGAIGGGSSDTYYGQGKGKDKDAFWNKVTIALAIFFVAVALAFFILKPTMAKPDTGNPDDYYGIPEQTTTVEGTTTEAPSSSEAPTSSSETPTSSSETPSQEETPSN